MVSRSPNLDQLRVFVSAVEEGSFSAAARKLGRAQSAVTYAIQELEADLGITLFDRSAYRPELSDAGRALLPRAKRVLHEVGAFQVQAASIGGGVEPELTIVVEPHYPMAELTGALLEFAGGFPSVTVHLYVEAISAPTEMVVAGKADLGLVVAMFAQTEQVERQHAGWLDLAAVCAPGHPLAKQQTRTGRLLSEDDVVDCLQLVLTDRFDPQPGRDHGVSAARTWRLADLGAKRAMLTAGIGWGSLPRHMIGDDIAAGRLTELRLERWAGTGQLPKLELAVVRRAQRPLGPAGTWLFTRLSKTA